MNDGQVTQTLLVESHRCLAAAVETAMARIGSQGQEPLLYPPNGAFSPEEQQALRSMKQSPAERSALEKLIAEACAMAFFDFFNLIDGTSDPELDPPPGTWVGAWLLAPLDDSDREMLHDAFYESYGAYDEATRRSG